jgi:hypothetical protein
MKVTKVFTIAIAVLALATPASRSRHPLGGGFRRILLPSAVLNAPVKGASACKALALREHLYNAGRDGGEPLTETVSAVTGTGPQLTGVTAGVTGAVLVVAGCGVCTC